MNAELKPVLHGFPVCHCESGGLRLPRAGIFRDRRREENAKIKKQPTKRGQRCSQAPSSSPSLIEMSLFRISKWSSILSIGVVAFSSGLTIYLLVSDSARRKEIRRRKNAVKAADISTAGPERFAPLRIGGRFVNPFEELIPPRPIFRAL